MRARNGNRVQTKLGFVIYGEQGTWKSSLCLEFAKFKREDGKPFRVLYLDGESGSVDTYLDDLEDEGIDTKNIYLVYTQSLSEIQDCIKKAGKNEDFYEIDEEGNETDKVVVDADGKPFRADAIVVDGTSVIYIASQQGLVQFSKKRASVKAEKDKLIGDARIVKVEGAGMELKDYQTLKFNGQDLILDLLASGKHFAVTSRETDEKRSEKGKDGSISSVATGRKIPEGFKDLRYNAKTVLHTFIDDDGVVKAQVENKDRSKIHMQNEIIEEPTLLDWEQIIEKNKGKKEFVLNNGLSDSVNREEKRYEKDIAKIDSQTNNKETEVKDIDGYHKAIEEAISNMSSMKKKSLKTEVAKKDLPMNYKKLTDLDKLQEYLKIVSA